MEVLADSIAIAVINAPVEKVNLTEWLFTLEDREYQACSAAHIACGSSVSTNGRRVSVNVEQVGDSLLVQHYAEDTGTREHCRVRSVSDSFSPAGRTKLDVTWELSTEKLTGSSCTLINHVRVSLTDEFSAMLTAAGINDLREIKMNMQRQLELHNTGETPLFAKDIEIKAVAGRWSKPAY